MNDRSPDERSDIRGIHAMQINPGYRFAHPGYTLNGWLTAPANPRR
jgi:hypothetical protein